MDLSSIVMFHIEAGPAVEALNAMKDQVPVPVMFFPTKQYYVSRGLLSPSEVHTRAVYGQYSVFEGLCALLEGSGLTFHNERTLVMISPERHPGERDALCQDKPNGWGPDFIHPPVANWK